MRISSIMLLAVALLAGCGRPPPEFAGARSIDSALNRAERELAEAKAFGLGEKRLAGKALSRKGLPGSARD